MSSSHIVEDTVVQRRRILIVSMKIFLAGGMLRFERLGRHLRRAGHEVCFCAFSGWVDPKWVGELPIIDGAQAARMDWDTTVLPGLAGFTESKDTLALLGALQHRHFGSRIQFVLNDRTFKDGFLAVNQAFKPHVVVFNNKDWPTEEFPHFLGNQFHYLIGGIDWQAFAEVATSPRADGPACRIGGQARKNPEPVIQALRCLPDGFVVSLYGEHPVDYPQRFADLIAAGRLELRGPISERELPAYYAGVDMVVTTETVAGWSNTAAEALASGRPLICTPVGTVAFARHDETALVLDDLRPASIASAIQSLWEDPERRRRLRVAGLLAMREFGWERYAEGLLALLDRAHESHYCFDPAHGLYGKWSLSRRSDGLDALLQTLPGKTVLDIGAAEGLIARACLDAGARALDGLELDGGRVERAKALNDKYADRTRFFQADLDASLATLQRVGLASTYDVVLYLGVHHHLSPEGRLRLFDALLDKCGERIFIRTDEALFTADGLDARFRSRGFRPGDHRPSPTGDQLGGLWVYHRELALGQPEARPVAPASLEFISYPKSGRTWIRHVLFKLGVDGNINFQHDGFEFNDASLPAHDFDAAARRRCYSGNRRVVYLERDPRAIIVSLFHQVTGRFKDFFHYQGSLSDFIRDDYFGTHALKRFRDMWAELGRMPNVLTVRYEDCHKDMAGVIRQILVHYGLASTDEAVVAAVEASTLEKMRKVEEEDNFPQPWLRKRQGASKVRKGQVAGYRDELSEQDLGYLDQVFFGEQAVGGLVALAAQRETLSESKRPHPVCIAGMHRSGTSMVTRLLMLCGLHLGEEKDMLGASSDNPEGFWEHKHLMLLNEGILNHFGGAWNMVPEFPPGCMNKLAMEPFRFLGRAILDRLISKKIWGWKDPRNSLTLPFWKTIVPELKVVCCFRDPRAVAESLQKRNGIQFHSGLRLWHDYNTHLLEALGTTQCLVCDYDRFFTEPEEEIKRLLRFVGLEVGDQQITDAARTISNGLRHHVVGKATEEIRLPHYILTLQESLRRLSSKDNIKEPLEDRISPHLECASSDAVGRRPGLILFVDDEASLTDAPIYLLHLLRWLRAKSTLEFRVLLRHGSPLESEFRALAETFTPATFGKDRRHLADVDLIYSSTCNNGKLISSLACDGIPVVTHVQELDCIIEEVGRENFDIIRRHTNHYIACSQAVADALIQRQQISADRISVHYQMIPVAEVVIRGNLNPRSTVRARHGMSDRAFVIAGRGAADWHGGADLFLQLAALLQRRFSGRKALQFVWIGHLSSDDSSRILRRDCVRLGLSGIAQFVGDQENPHELLHACDLFCLPSREDPFQVEMLEVGALSIPFVCFDSPGGAKDFAARGAGFTVPYLDVPAMVEKCAQLIEDEPLRQRTGMAVGNFVREDFDVEVLAPRVEALLNSLLPALASCARRVDSLHKEGGTLMESEDRTRALTWMRPLLELAPDDLEWVRVLSKVCCQLGDLGGTAQQFDRDTTLATQRPTRHALQDSSQMQQQRYSEAEAAARRALELAPLDLDMLRLLAPLAHQEERYAEACGCYATITRLAPRDVEARVSRAACSAAQGHRVLAELVLEEALDLQPDHPEALALLAQLSSNPQALVAIDYDILVPIFNAPDDVRRCVESLLRHTKPRHTIYLLNDASPDPRIAPLLHEFAAKHAHIKVVTAIQNGGFVTNMNVGFGLSRRDVVILNSDTEVTADWLQRMDRCRRSNDKIGIVSPLSNNATILSVPVMNTRNALPDGMTPDEFASLVVANSQRAYPRIPTAVGFCMLITRATLDAVGLFDAAFGLGYGEECDLCMRAWAAGIESVCCDDAYVQHNGEASFGSVQGIGERKQRNAELLSFRWPNYSKAVYRYCQQNPLRQLQERLQKVLRPTTGSQGPNVLQVIHSYNLPGGTELHTQDVVDRLVKRFRQTVVFPGQIPAWTDFAEASSKSVARVVVFNRGNVAPTHRYLGQPGDLRSALVEESFSQFIAGGDYDIVHFQHLAGWGSLRLPRIAKEQGKRCVLSVHDYFMLCPEYILINSDGKRCPKNRAGAADEDCLRCLQTKRVVVQAGAPELADYLALRESLTREVMEVMDAVVVPSAFVREKLLAAFGNQFADRIRVIPHGITVLRRSRPACRKRGVLRVGVLGSLNIQKGLQMVIEAAALLKSSSVRLEVLGHVPPAAEDALSRVSVKRHGGYRREDLPELLREIDLVLIPSLFDETFCLTLSEAQALGRPVLASAVGAIPERIVDGETGFLFSPATGQALAARLRELCAAPDLIAAVAERVLQLDIKTMDQNAQDYAELYQMLLQAPPRSIAEEKAHIVALPGPQWSWREQDFTSRVAETSLTSIIILAHNQLVHTRCCLESIAAHTSERHEIILVDNGSTDGTVAWAREYAQARTNVRLIENRSNRGFAAGNNQGVAIASGDFIVLLNNDTVATPGWLRNMLKVVREHPKTGVVGPRSNWVYGRQKVDEVGYKSLEELPAFATAWAAQHAGQSRVANRVVGFCLLARREVIEAVGGLDEQFGSGNFEDDDFCVRAHLAGFETRIADDSFVHHVGNATFTGAGIDYGKAMQTNWSLFKSKWAIPSETPPFPGYLTPDVAPPGVALKVSLPDLRLTHRISADGRCWMDKLVAAAAEAKPIALPPCALVGQLREARQFLQQKKLPAAWGATRAVLKHRPFHPEAYLLLAEIALEAQDSAAAQACAQFARQIAPEFRPAKKFLKGKLHGHLKPEWLVLPEEIGKHKAESRNWLSVCLIVKNEERFLGQCLTSVKGLAHQIVVVDTGSTDRTVEIAREHGAHVHPFAWCDDFSAARNAALEHATGDWVLMLDADEELPPEQHAALRKLLHTPSVISWRLPLQDVGREAEGCSYVPRLFRNAPGLYYAGRVHEQVFTSIEERRQEWGLDTRLGDATLRHHGYTKELTLERDKVGRNLRLLEQAVLETPGDTNLLMNYGLELTRSGRQEEGLRQYRAAFDTMAGRPSAQVVPEMREMLLSQFCTQLMAAKRHAKIVQVLTSPLARAGSGLTASLHFTLGLAQTELKDFAAAAEQFRQCLAKRDRPALTPVNVEIRKAGPRHCLALCLEQMGEIGAADEEFRRAIEAEPQARPLRRDYARFLAAHERQADALNLLFALANEKPTDSQVWQQGGQLALTRPEFLEVAVDWTAGAAEHLPDDPALVQQRAEALMLAGQCGAALPLWRRWPPASNQALAAALVLCETAVGENQFSLEAADEAAVSREFVKWYQKLLQFNARQTVESLNAKLEVLERTLPSAASILASALAEAAETVGV